MAAAVSRIEVVRKNAAGGDGHIDTVVKLWFWNKNQALDTLCKHLGLLKADLVPPGSAAPVAIYELPEGARVVTK
jgi:hypothetical protein